MKFTLNAKRLKSKQCEFMDYCGSVGFTSSTVYWIKIFTVHTKSKFIQCIWGFITGFAIPYFFCQLQTELLAESLSREILSAGRSRMLQTCHDPASLCFIVTQATDHIMLTNGPQSSVLLSIHPLYNTTL